MSSWLGRSLESCGSAARSLIRARCRRFSSRSLRSPMRSTCRSGARSSGTRRSTTTTASIRSVKGRAVAGILACLSCLKCRMTWGSVVMLCIQSRVRSRPSTRSVNSAWTFVEVSRCLTPHSAESRLGRTVALGRGFVVVRQLLSAGKVSRQLISAGRWLLDGFVVRACFGHDSTVELGARARSGG